MGILLIARSDLLMTVLPFLWGIAMIAGGFAKVQIAFDLRRVERDRWWLMLLGALVSFLMGVISVTHPVFLALTVTQIAAVAWWRRRWTLGAMFAVRGN
jgi:uncharacterized membrane protein HdeD (DUF308 family)